MKLFHLLLSKLQSAVRFFRRPIVVIVYRPAIAQRLRSFSPVRLTAAEAARYGQLSLL
jgi:hypothetical protein